MKYRETCADGTFKAWGAGFSYEYLADISTLKVSRAEKDYTLAQIKFDKYIAKDPLSFVQALDKTNQIKAMMLSNNETIILSDVLDDSRLGALVLSGAQVSVHAFDLKFKNFSRVSRQLANTFELKHFKIKRFRSDNGENTFYVARVQTQHDNSVSVRACTLEGMLASLSDRTVRDLITMEFGHQFEKSAYSLLNLSAKLAIIGRVVDVNFIPENKLKNKHSLLNAQKQHSSASDGGHGSSE